MLPTQENTRLSFGLFEVDLSSGELWKAGFRIKLQSQPFKVLTCLLEKPGQVVSREELQERLWGKDTVVDFDHSLGTAVNKIREALGDSADNPRFVETLSRRGYRFVAPVTRVNVPVPLIIATPAVHTAEAKMAETSEAPLQQALTEATPLAVPAATSPAITAPVTPQATVATQNATGASVQAHPEQTPTRSRAIYWAAGAVLLAIGALWTGFLAGKRQKSATPRQISQVTHSGHLAPLDKSTENFSAAVTDGPYLYAPMLESGRYGLSAIEIAGGNSITMQIPSDVAGPTLGDISPDGSHLLVRDHLSPDSEQPLWIIPTLGGSAQRVGNVLAHDATWMPDGSTILYANGNELFTTRTNSGLPQKFATVPGRAFWLRWNSDGKLLRFTVIDSLTHTVGLYQVSASDHDVKRILPGFSQPSSECCGVWTADGSSYVFQSSHGGNENLWMLAGESTTSPRQLTNGPLQFQSPVASRTGHKIYFQGVDARSELLRVSPSGDLIPDTSFLSGAVRVDYSHDGNWVAWVDTNGQLWRARLNGMERLQLSPDGVDVFMVRWSPDGTKLAVMAREQGKAWKIYLIPANGGEYHPLLAEDRNEADPTWSPDGKLLAFGRLNDLLGKESAERGLYLLHLDQGNVEAIPDSDGLFSPRLSPDGRYLAAMTLNQRELRIFDFSSRSWKTLLNTSAADPFWSPDGRFLYVHASLDPSQPIEKVAVPSGAITVLVRLSDSRAQGAVDYIFGGLTKEGTPLVRSRVFTGNMFSLDLDK